MRENENEVLSTWKLPTQRFRLFFSEKKRKFCGLGNLFFQKRTWWLKSKPSWHFWVFCVHFTFKYSGVLLFFQMCTCMCLFASVFCCIENFKSFKILHNKTTKICHKVSLPESVPWSCASQLVAAGSVKQSISSNCSSASHSELTDTTTVTLHV